jgi:hypothetical protein
MPIDFTILNRQVRDLSASLRASHDERLSRIEWACEQLRAEADRWEAWCEVVREKHARAPWLLACPAEPLDTVRPLPACPPAYALAASDGSQIDLDRHGPAECYLINVGLVLLRYGVDPTCRLWATPRLCYTEDELALVDPGSGRRYAVEGALVSATRDVAEGQLLAHIAADLDPDLPGLALQDGTLIRWPLSGLDPFVRDHYLQGYLEALDVLRDAGTPLASYISRPRAPEVTGLVRLIVDPEMERGSRNGAPDDPCRGLLDQMLFARLLRPGQRGPLFMSMSRINVEHYGEHAIYFFYLNAGREIARVELPRWVARSPELVDRLHAVIYDQCQRGAGYPVALARAHEQAVVREGDRRAFRQLLESSLLRSRLSSAGSLKQAAKDRPIV